AQSSGMAAIKELPTAGIEPVEQAITGEAEEEHARRLARIIVSDIILYTDVEVEDAIKRGRFYHELKEEIREGIRYFKKKSPASVPVERYLKEAFEEFLSKKRKEFGII
ncbi:MAG: hypothetical protein WA162_03200, partial [Thermodesulfobacteriota bacterium]